jgi:hypothetical protein
LTKAEYDALKNGYQRSAKVLITGGVNTPVLFITPFADGTVYNLTSMRFTLLDGTGSGGAESALTVNGFYFYADDTGYLTYTATPET